MISSCQIDQFNRSQEIDVVIPPLRNCETGSRVDIQALLDIPSK